MTAISLPDISRFVLHDVSWQGYETLLREVGDRRVFITYDRGTLELMSPSPKHERVSSLITRLIWTYTEELRIPIATFGMTTFRREDLERGLEPDACFYIRNESTMRHRDAIDLNVDPPADLAIEVEVSRSALDRVSIYEELRVPELWRWDDERLTIWLLDDAGKYSPSDRSLNLPGLPPTVVERFVSLRKTKDELSWGLAFRDWARQQAEGAGGTGGNV
jgi:Uma2 family endonuclease